MNIIGCLDKPTEGQYILDDVAVAGMDDDQLAEIRNRKLGFVFQTFNLIPRRPALKQVMLPMLYNRGLKDHEARAIAALERVGLSDRMDHKPNELSGGQQQRVAIARALVNDPVIILGDEPTGNLDTRTSIEIMGIFQEINDQGNTIVMVTHELDIAAYCKRIVVMRDGQIISDTRNENRRSARREIDALNQAELEAKLA
jgi:putative ABC transport system ATP-binding protein